MSTSYHIKKEIGDNNYFFIWPMCAFNEFCTNLEDAKKEYETRIKENPKDNYQLVSYDTVREGWIFKRIIGITGKEIILNNHNGKNI